ncbi:MAG: hypothetical protein ACRCXM_08955 [Beijerinckiaceae bacterium]
MPKGNPNPSPHTRFKPGVSGNPSGKSTEVQVLEGQAALIALKLRHWSLSSLQEKMDAGTLTIHEVLNSDALRLFKDSEDRAHGTPKQAVEHTGESGGPIVFQTVYETKPE